MQRYKLETVKVFDPSYSIIVGKETITTPDDQGEWIKYEDYIKELHQYDEIVQFYIIMKDEEDVQERYKKKIEEMLNEARKKEEDFLKEWRQNNKWSR